LNAGHPGGELVRRLGADLRILGETGHHDGFEVRCHGIKTAWFKDPDGNILALVGH